MAIPDLRSIQLIRAFFLECVITNDEADPLVQLGTTKFKLSHKVSPAFSLDDDEVLIDLLVQCQPIDAQSDVPLEVSGRFRLHLLFRVLNLAQHLELSQDGHNQPDHELILTLISVAYSTARGLITAKTADTILRDFALPLLDVRELANSH